MQNTRSYFHHIKNETEFLIKDSQPELYDNIFLEDLIFLFNEQDFFKNLLNKLLHKHKHQQNISIEQLSKESLALEAVNFYSLRMLVIHLKWLDTQPERKHILIDRFKESHPYDSLSDFMNQYNSSIGKETMNTREISTFKDLKAFESGTRQGKREKRRTQSEVLNIRADQQSSTENTIKEEAVLLQNEKDEQDQDPNEINQIKSEIRSLQDSETEAVNPEQYTTRTEHRNFDMKKTVILTYSNLNFRGLGRELRDQTKEITVKTLNQKGTTHFDHEMNEFLGNKRKDFLVIAFEEMEDLRHFKYIKQFLNEKTRKGAFSKKKIILLMSIHISLDSQNYISASRNSGIHFGYHEDDWEYVVIENLVESHYKWVFFVVFRDCLVC